MRLPWQSSRINGKGWFFQTPATLLAISSENLMKTLRELLNTAPPFLPINFWSKTIKMQRTLQVEITELNLISFLLLHICNEASFKGELWLVHSRSQRTPSFWSAPRIATSGKVQFSEWVCAEHESRTFGVGLASKRADSWCWTKGGRSIEIATSVSSITNINFYPVLSY